MNSFNIFKENKYPRCLLVATDIEDRGAYVGFLIDELTHEIEPLFLSKSRKFNNPLLAFTEVPENTYIAINNEFTRLYDLIHGRYPNVII